ncbi:MAG: ABC transporter substrate-binding protein [Alphaproteobacteria bacterium]|nr:ABC transporter substrate-binding protein [Alphaproteobacteria bacterium]
MTFKLETGPQFSDLLEADKEHVKFALQHGATRREVMGWLMASGATVAAAGSIVTGAGEAIAATPKKGGNLLYAASLHGPADTLDPIIFTSGIDYQRGRLHYNGLLRLSPTLEPQAELAEEFEANKDTTEWTFRLRKGVKWHDGSPFTADDVIYSMNRHQGEDSKSNAKGYLTSVQEWVKVDNETVRVKLKYPNADIPALMGIYQFKIVKNGTTEFANPVGTGPYRLEEFKPGVRSIHVRNDDYWGTMPNIDRVEVFAITDGTARLNAVLSGDVHMVVTVDPKTIPQLDASDKADLLSTPSNQWNGICCMKNQLPGSSDDFVLGMKHLPRRERIVKNILRGHGTVGNDHPISNAYPEHCKHLPVRAYDPDKAKFHFKKAGINSAELYVAPVNVGIEETCLLIQREAAKIGFNLKLKKVPNDGYWGAIWLKKPLNVVTWLMRPTAHAMLSVAFAPDAPWNDTRWNNPRMGDLLKMSAGETDPAKREEMFCEMQTLVHNEGGWVIPSHNNYLDGISKKVKGLVKHPIGNTGGYEWPETAWLEG